MSGPPPLGTVLVLGGSIGGLLAARVLSDVADEVVIVERDEVVGVDGPRRGVPQGRHVHGLLARGQQTLEALFPGFRAEAVARGIPTADLGELRWYFHGRRLSPAATGLTCVSADRPVLEHLVRERVLQRDNVRLLERHDVETLLFTDDSSAVVGASIRDLRSGRSTDVRAHLTIDALGRGSRGARWLADHGYRRPAEESVRIDLAYTSRHYRVDEALLHGDMSINPVSSPDQPRGGFFSRVQDGLSIVSLTGMVGDHAPADPEGFHAWAASMPVPDIHEVMLAGTPTDQPVQFRFPASVRRRYEDTPRLPDRLLAIGDAICSFNPVYGQGMTVAALEALLLGELARSGPPDPATYYSEVAKLLDTPWGVSTAGDLQYLDVEVPDEAREASAYLARAQLAASVDPEVTRVFMRVAGLVDPPEALATPEMAERVAVAAAQADRQARQS